MALISTVSDGTEEFAAPFRHSSKLSSFETLTQKKKGKTTHIWECVGMYVWMDGWMVSNT